jgi:lysophospholipase L1-like esterase
VELLNAGVRAIASDRVRIVVGEMLRQAPDLLLVYVGHNQLLDARLNAAALEPFWRRRVRSAIQNGGIGRALRWALPRPVPALQILAGPDAREFGPVTAAERATVEAAYGADLAAMCDAANAAGVPIVLVEPVSSLLRIPELAEATDPHTERQVRIRARMQALAADPATDLTADAAEEARTAPGSAFAHYLAGVVALTHGDRDAAIAALREARRLDEHPWRVTESMAAVIQDVGDRCGARVLVPETAFLADPRYLQIGDPLFEDQVHPSVPGVYLLAQAVADGIAPLLPPGTTWAIADPLAVTPPPPVPSALRPAPAEPAAVGQPQR